MTSEDDSLLHPWQPPLHPLGPMPFWPLPQRRWTDPSRGTSVWSLKFTDSHCVLYPVQKARDSGIDTWRCTILGSKGDNALGHTVTQ